MSKIQTNAPPEGRVKLEFSKVSTNPLMPLADELEKPTPGNANHSVTPICDSHKTRTDTVGLHHLTVSIEPKGCRSRVLLDGVSSVEIYELFLGVVKRDFLCTRGSLLPQPVYCMRCGSSKIFAVKFNGAAHIVVAPISTAFTQKCGVTKRSTTGRLVAEPKRLHRTNY